MTPTQSATVAWLAAGDTGLSSETMAYWLGLGTIPGEINHPHDPDDLDRCLQLLAAILALLDAEAEACAEACRSEQLMTVCDATDAAYMHAIDDCVKAIRARIAARRGGAKP